MSVTIKLMIAVLFPVLTFSGCVASRSYPVEPPRPNHTAFQPTVVQASYFSPEVAELPKDEELPTPKPGKGDATATLPSPQLNSKSPGMGLPQLIGLTLERHPRLAQLSWAVETARGRAVQAGLYPNPTLSITADELADRTGPVGIWTAPYFQQEIVRGNKLELSQAAALKEVDQAALAIITERYRLFTDVRQGYWEVVTLQRRVEILNELITLADKSVENANQLLKAKEGSRLDVLQLQVDLERYRADLEATQSSLPAAYRRLAASIGVQDLPPAPVVGDLEIPLPDYDLERVRVYVLGIHPELRSAQVGVERAQLVLKRATVEPVPNVTVGAGYVYQGQNRSNDLSIGASLPIPVWNRKQGNVYAAHSQIGEAINEVGRVGNDLVGRLATSSSVYAAARKRAEKYKASILPKAEESYQLSLKAYQGGQFEYLRVLQAQRAVAEARLEYLRSLGEMWRAASEVAGLMLEDEWPLSPGPAPAR